MASITTLHRVYRLEQAIRAMDNVLEAESPEPGSSITIAEKQSLAHARNIMEGLKETYSTQYQAQYAKEQKELDESS